MFGRYIPMVPIYILMVQDTPQTQRRFKRRRARRKTIVTSRAENIHEEHSYDFSNKNGGFNMIQPRKMVASGCLLHSELENGPFIDNL